MVRAHCWRCCNAPSRISIFFSIATRFGQPCGYGVQRTCWVDDEGMEIGESEDDDARIAMQLIAIVVGESERFEPTAKASQLT